MELDHIVVQGARQHNLDVEELRIPKRRLVVFTGVSGSGKSSMAFDTLYAEGQRRYVESLSSYARQFLGQMEKPKFDHIRGLSPTIAIEQKTATNNPRSTVGTITEIYDYLRVLYARVGIQHCHLCQKRLEALTTDQIVSRVRPIDDAVFVLAPLVKHRKGEYRDLLENLQQRGFARVRIDGEVHRLDEAPVLDKRRKHTLELIVDRITPTKTAQTRLVEAIETALSEGKGEIAILAQGDDGQGISRFSQSRYCLDCDVALPELSPQSFSFNSPLGMCESCNGLGRAMEIDPKLVIPDPSLSLNEGAVHPWSGAVERASGWTYNILLALKERFHIDLDKPWEKLSRAHRDLILYGTGAERISVKWRGRRSSGKWSTRFEGVANTMVRRYRETSSEGMRRHYARYFADKVCSACHGSRLRAESRAVKVANASIVDVVQLTVGKAHDHFSTIELDGNDALVAEEVLKEINGRLGFLRDVGLDYLTLDRQGPTLSGGEAQRIRLASQLGSELSGVMYVLDEPSIGLHQRDNTRLIATLKRLRDLGNSVIVVEHDHETIEAADHIVDFGPGAGELGGQVIYTGNPRQLRRASTLTGEYIGGKKEIAVPPKRREGIGHLTIEGARANNLKNISVDLPLGTFTAVSGVSGAGKSSLVLGILYPAVSHHLGGKKQKIGEHSSIKGLKAINKVIHIDQSPIGRTPRSNPATYTKVFDQIRSIFAQLPDARARGYKPGRFSFNVKGGRCDACDGDGMKCVEMHFLPDVYVPCEVCRGKRYKNATLAIRYRGLSISDVLALSVRQALSVFENYPQVRNILQTLIDVGLDYIKLGQPATTLSGGEAQRIKLSRELSKRATGQTLYVLDEPTTGLHFEDVRKLLDVLQRLVDAGNTVVVIEHNLDVLKCADHIIEVGPGGGEAGGHIVGAGTPESIAQLENCPTAPFLRKVLTTPPKKRSHRKASKQKRSGARQVAATQQRV